MEFRKKSIILCGFKASGKSTLGRLLAERLGFEYIDTDRLVEALYYQKYGYHTPFRKIFESLGEQGFEELEEEVVRGIRNENAVVSCGGRTVLNPINQARLKQVGNIVYLRVPRAILRERLFAKMEERPVFLETEADFERLLAQRAPAYELAAEIIADVDSLDPQENLTKLIKAISGK